MKVTPETNTQRIPFFTQSNINAERNQDAFNQMVKYREGLEEMILFTQITPLKKSRILTELMNVTEWINKRK